MNTLTAIFERCMSASIARTATVVAWREYHDMDGLVGAEMPEHVAGAVIARSTNSRLPARERILKERGNSGLRLRPATALQNS